MKFYMNILCRFHDNITVQLYFIFYNFRCAPDKNTHYWFPIFATAHFTKDLEQKKENSLKSIRC